MALVDHRLKLNEVIGFSARIDPVVYQRRFLADSFLTDGFLVASFLSDDFLPDLAFGQSPRQPWR